MNCTMNYALRNQLLSCLSCAHPSLKRPASEYTFLLSSPISIPHWRNSVRQRNVSHCHNSTGANSGAGTRRRTNRHWQAHGAPGHVVERRTWRSHVRSVQQRAAAPSGASTWRLPRPTQRCSRIARESWRSQQERRNVSSRAPADGALQVRRTSIVATLISDQRARKEAPRPWKARATT